MFRTSLAVSLLGVLCLSSLGRCAVAEEGRRIYRLTVEVSVPGGPVTSADQTDHVPHLVATYLQGFFAIDRFRTFVTFSLGEYSREKVEPSRTSKWVPNWVPNKKPAEADRPVKSR
jgi:hypothetical protein